MLRTLKRLELFNRICHFFFFCSEQKKDLPQLTNHSTENKNPSLALPVIHLRSRRSASANRQDEFVHPLQKYSNSCSTIYVDDSTVSQPNWKAMIKCVSIAIHSHIAHRKSNKTMTIFDEKLHPLSVNFSFKKINHVRMKRFFFLFRKIQFPIITINKFLNRKRSIDS